MLLTPMRDDAPLAGQRLHPQAHGFILESLDDDDLNRHRSIEPLGAQQPLRLRREAYGNGATQEAPPLVVHVVDEVDRGRRVAVEEISIDTTNGPWQSNAAKYSP